MGPVLRGPGRPAAGRRPGATRRGRDRRRDRDHRRRRRNAARPRRARLSLPVPGVVAGRDAGCRDRALGRHRHRRRVRRGPCRRWRTHDDLRERRAPALLPVLGPGRPPRDVPHDRAEPGRHRAAHRARRRERPCRDRPGGRPVLLGLRRLLETHPPHGEPRFRGVPRRGGPRRRVPRRRGHPVRPVPRPGDRWRRCVAGLRHGRQRRSRGRRPTGGRGARWVDPSRGPGRWRRSVRLRPDLDHAGIHRGRCANRSSGADPRRPATLPRRRDRRGADTARRERARVLLVARWADDRDPRPASRRRCAGSRAGAPPRAAPGVSDERRPPAARGRDTGHRPPPVLHRQRDRGHPVRARSPRVRAVRVPGASLLRPVRPQSSLLGAGQQRDRAAAHRREQPRSRRRDPGRRQRPARGRHRLDRVLEPLAGPVSATIAA